MRWIVSLILAATGVVLLYIFAGGAFVSPSASPPQGDPWGSALSPLWDATLKGAALLFCAVLAVVWAGGIVFWGQRLHRSPGDPTGWSPVLQAAFSLNALAAAAVIFGLSMAMMDKAAVTTIGSLYILGLFLGLVGSALAFALLWLRKSRVLFASTLLVHLFEVGSLIAVCVLGFGG
ncbi:MAG: hypothetical protein JXA90_01955 [Planctomycetes bacterium]|nr:hypothetical protein [Planctomycetota bacterium]